jgi:hypothetical protein
MNNEEIKAETTTSSLPIGNTVLAEGGNWIATADRLPKAGETVLTMPHYKVLPFGNTEDDRSYDATDTTFWEWQGSVDDGCAVVAKPFPTHWMPLPPPPAFG